MAFNPVEMESPITTPESADVTYSIRTANGSLRVHFTCPPLN